VPALPVELPFDAVAFGRKRALAPKHVPDELALARNGLDRQTGEDPEVVRLPAASREEDGAIQRDAATVGIDPNRGGPELPQIGVLGIEPVRPGHAASVTNIKSERAGFAGPFAVPTS
jgi:hypothetical protein